MNNTAQEITAQEIISNLQTGLEKLQNLTITPQISNLINTIENKIKQLKENQSFDYNQMKEDLWNINEQVLKAIVFNMM
jgi:hypothetical protein